MNETDLPSPYTFLSLFSGIGGFDLGLERAGWHCIGQVEIDLYCQSVLAHHWPNVKRMGDIKHVNGTEFGQPYLICGGPPCQPASVAGKRRGETDDRWLWNEALRIIRQLVPTWCLLENVRGLVTLKQGVVFDSLLSELEDIGYEVQSFIIPACAVDAPHRRDRVWIVAHSQRNQHIDTKPSCACKKNELSCLHRSPDRPSGKSCGASPVQCTCKDHDAHSNCSRQSQPSRCIKDQREWPGNLCEDVPHTSMLQRETIQRDKQNGALPGNVADPACIRQQRNGTIGEQESSARNKTPLSHGYSETNRAAEWEPEPPICRLVNGLPGRLAQLRAYGNAVVPVLVEVIGRAIIEADRMNCNEI